MLGIILSALCSVWLKVFDVDKQFLPPILKMRNLRQMVFPHLEIVCLLPNSDNIFSSYVLVFSDAAIM